MKEEKKESGPQIENGHIDIANELAEALARIDFFVYEIRVIWALLRMTWGYAERDKKGKYITKINRKGNRQIMKKEMAKITTKQWISLTGLDKANIYKALRSLVKRNIVIKSKNQYGSIIYGINKHYKQWDKEGFGVPQDTKIKVNENRCPTRHHLVSHKTPPSVPQDTKIIPKPLEDKPLPDHEENSLKKTYIKKEKTDIYNLEKEEGKREENSLAKEIFDYWNSLDIFEHKTFNFFKDDIRASLKDHSLEEIKDTIKNYSIILTDKRYFYSYEHTLLGFLEIKNFEKFKDLEKAKNNFSLKKIDNKPELSDDTQGSEQERYKPEPGIKETVEERKARYKESEKRMKELKEELNNKKGG